MDAGGLRKLRYHRAMEMIARRLDEKGAMPADVRPIGTLPKVARYAYERGVVSLEVMEQAIAFGTAYLSKSLPKKATTGPPPERARRFGKHREHRVGRRRLPRRRHQRPDPDAQQRLQIITR